MLLGTAMMGARAAVEVSVDFFHDSLEPYGDWREVADYGYCWQPRDVDPDWRPYSDGNWVYTDAGWTWVSDEPYSWAVYHYGRWLRVDQVGWVWVPGTEWGPAWVSWRRGPRHVGWAPLPPEARFSRSVGFTGRVDADFDIGPANYRFVEVRNFGAPRLRTVFVEPQENITIINQTTNITRITYVNNVVYNEGPQYDVISRKSAQPIRRLKLERREEIEGDPRTVRPEQLRARVEGESLRVVAPQFDPKPASAPRKVAAKVEKAEVDRGWKNAGPPAEVAKLRTKIKSEPATPVELAQPPKKDKVPDALPAAPTKPDAVPSSIPPTTEKPAKRKGKNARGQESTGKPGDADGAPAPGQPGDAKKPQGAPPIDKPVPSDKPAASDQMPKLEKPGKRGKTAKPPTSDANPQPPSTPPTQPKKAKGKGTDGQPNPAEGLPAPVAPPKDVESAAPKRKLPPPDAVTPDREKARSNQGDARPKPQRPPARGIEDNVPQNPKPRAQERKPEAPQQAAPTEVQRQPDQRVKEKGKGKGKEEKKDEGLPDGSPK